MAGSVTNTGGISSLLRAAQAPAINKKANQQIAQAVINKTPNVGKKSGASLDLASANSSPPPNLPRGSIVDKLV